MHLIASFDAMKLLITLFYSRSMHLIILSQDAVNSILYNGDIIPQDIGSANLKIAMQFPVSLSHYLTVQSFDIVIR